MRRIEYEYYDTIAVKGHHRLHVIGECKTIEDITRAIDCSNEKVASFGYEEEQWVITHVQVTKWFEDDVFIKSETVEEQIMIYPAD